MPDNAADRKDVRRREKEYRDTIASADSVVRNTMSTVDGRRWMWDTLSLCHVFSNTFTGDALQSAFAEGQRSIGLALMATILRACPDAYIQAQRESNDRNTATERRSSPNPDGGNPGREGYPEGDDPTTGDLFGIETVPSGYDAFN